MKIKFKSIRRNLKTNGDEHVVEYITKLLEKEVEEGFNVLCFEETRDGKKIMNRFEYNEDTLRIFSGPSSLFCKLDQVIKNNYAVGGQIGSVFIYTKMIEINVEDSNNLTFKYLVGADEKLNDGVIINIELTLSN